MYPVTPDTPAIHDAAGSGEGEEARLLERLARGEAGAFERLVEMHQERVMRLAHRLLGWRGGAAEDVAQEVFLVALRRIGSFRGESSLATWLSAITIRQCRREKWRIWRRWHRRLGQWMSGGEAGPAGPADAPAERDEMAVRVRQAVERLPPSEREVVVLHYLEGMEVAEMAAALGASRNAIDVRLHRARQRLKELLRELAEP
jgi:RNA polymerase sigma-70 factor (ECF subfamily)